MTDPGTPTEKTEKDAVSTAHCQMSQQQEPRPREDR